MRALLCSALLALSIAAPAQAGNLLDLDVVDRDTGSTLPTYEQDGRLYVVGVPGHRYSVRLSNRTGARVLAVLSVDGVNAVTGETASSSQNGYVLDAWQSADIKGWRKNLNEVAQFNFTSLPNSYAARTGRPTNVGVIGVAVFTEKVEQPELSFEREAPRPWAKRSEADAAAAAPAPPAPAAESGIAASAAKRAPLDAVRQKSERLGTGHGQREWARVTTTHFERASQYPAETLSIWYDSYRNLAERGIVPRRPIARFVPDPFPNGFVADPPPAWR